MVSLIPVLLTFAIILPFVTACPSVGLSGVQRVVMPALLSSAYSRERMFIAPESESDLTT